MMTDPDHLRVVRHVALEAAVREAVLEVLTLVGHKKEHIPPVVSSDTVSQTTVNHNSFKQAHAEQLNSLYIYEAYWYSMTAAVHHRARFSLPNHHQLRFSHFNQPKASSTLQPANSPSNHAHIIRILIRVYFENSFRWKPIEEQKLTRRR
jgi:hypothetical protein